jgi:hypothetical protein
MAGKSKKRGIFKEVFSEATKRLLNVFGFEVVEIVKTETDENEVAKTQSTSLKSKQAANTCWILKLAKFKDEKDEDIEYRSEQLSVKESKPKYALLMTIISLIMINDSPIEEEILWNQLKKLDIQRKVDHVVFGNVEKVLDEFVKVLYLIKKTTTSQDGNSHTYTIGKRTFKEIKEKFEVLKFISGITGTSVDRSTLAEFRMGDETQQSTNPSTEETISMDQEE